MDEYCFEHQGRTRQKMYTCADCRAQICSDCVVLLKKHQPCPVYRKAQVDQILRRAIWPVLNKA